MMYHGLLPLTFASFFPSASHTSTHNFYHYFSTLSLRLSPRPLGSLFLFRHPPKSNLQRFVNPPGTPVFSAKSGGPPDLDCLAYPSGFQDTIPSFCNRQSHLPSCGRVMVRNITRSELPMPVRSTTFLLGTRRTPLEPTILFFTAVPIATPFLPLSLTGAIPCFFQRRFHVHRRYPPAFSTRFHLLAVFSSSSGAVRKSIKGLFEHPLVPSNLAIRPCNPL